MRTFILNLNEYTSTIVMEKQLPSLLCLGVSFLLALGVVSGQAPLYYKRGSSVKLEPKINEPITSIEWKFKTDIVAEYVKGIVDLNFYEPFAGNATLDLITGVLTITNMDQRHQGEYTLEVNGKILNLKFYVTEVKELPKPSVWFQPIICKTQSNCTAVCEFQPEPPKDHQFGPITYSWKQDSGAWTTGERSMLFFKNETEKVVKFSCLAKNPVSEQESDAKENPFYVVPTNPAGAIVGVLVVVVVLIVGGVVGYKKRLHKKIMECRKTEEPTDGSAPPKEETGPGNSGSPSENLPMMNTNGAP